MGVFVVAIGTMAATAFATIPSFEVVVFGKNLISLGGIIKIDAFHQCIWINRIHGAKIRLTFEMDGVHQINSCI